MPNKTNNKMEYGYYVDHAGLYYVSTRSGVFYESFDINGVISILDSPEINILYLCYIPKENK